MRNVDTNKQAVVCPGYVQAGQTYVQVGHTYVRSNNARLVLLVKKKPLYLSLNKKDPGFTISRSHTLQEAIAVPIIKVFYSSNKLYNKY